jgi:2Fe-2S ferredoxin
MPHVLFEPWARVVEVPEGRNLLQAALADLLPLRHDCKGNASCSTCRVEVTRGVENLTPIQPEEARLLEVAGLAPPWRLACRVRPTGDAAVKVPDRVVDVRERSPGRVLGG